MKTRMKATKKIKIPITEDFQEMINLLAVYTDANNRLAALQTEANDNLMLWLDESKVEYAKLQETLTKAEAAIEGIVRRHPEWFQEKKSIKTPFGTVKSTSTPKLVIPNEEATMVRLQLKAERSQIAAEAARAEGKDVPIFDDKAFVRTKQELDREALEKLEDHELAELGISRIKEESVSVKPATLDMGKAVKEAVEQQEAA
ncbi:MAG: hypothetical protein ABS95_01185 [Verrucomicrobia bacterium SCN 57-15]|nr:MAG: hypothetical protein ABS95_01185 [Verrucomicrobia bacterium SCN 57-15]